MQTNTENAIKKQRVRQFMENEGLGALALSSICNFSWFTCGGSNYIGTAAEVGASTVIITPDFQYIVCDNIEADRIRNEEVKDQGFDFITGNWYEMNRNELIRKVIGNSILGSDTPIPGAKDISSSFDQLRSSLTSDEIERYKWLGKQVGECLSETAHTIKTGMTEHEIGAVMDELLIAKGIVPTLTLIAADERIFKYRHPLPTDKKLNRTAMLVTGARKWGLVISATRMVNFGKLIDDLRHRHDAVCKVDAALISATKPGAIVGDIFNKAVDIYSGTGFPGEWKLHHQGGPTGYKGRDFRANPESKAIVQDNQAFAWNPSITGTKTEDTIIATSSCTEIISASSDWPMIDVEVNGLIIQRPDILIR